MIREQYGAKWFGPMARDLRETRCNWASLVAQMVKNLPALQETWVRSLGLEAPLEEGMGSHSSVLAW